MIVSNWGLRSTIPFPCSRQLAVP